MYKIFYTKEARDKIIKFDKKLKLRIKKAIEKIAQNPSLGKKLTQELSEMQSYRSGDYRIIYRIYHRKLLVLVLGIGHRKDVYRKISRQTQTI